MTCGIYLLDFIGTDKVYVGQSKNIEKRFIVHCNDLRKGSHTNKMNVAYSRYGMPAVEVLEICEEHELDSREKYHIILWNAVSDGFNYLHNPNGGSCSGEDNAKSLYSNNQIISAVEYILRNPEQSLVTVSKVLDMQYNIVKSVSNGASHGWLEDVIPEKYKELLARVGTRNNKGENQGSSIYSNKQIYNVLIELLLDVTIPNIIVANKCKVTESVVVAVCNGGYTWLKDKYPEEYQELLEKLPEKRAYSRSAKARGISYPPVKSPLDNSIHYIDNVNKFAKANGLDTGSLNKVLNKKANSTKGWRLATVEETQLP